MIITVTPNPAIDSTWSVDGVTHGTSHRVAPGAHRAGGKGINVARVLAAQGFPVAILTTAGGSTGEQLAADIRSTGIDHELVAVTAETRRSLAFYDRVEDDTMIFNESGVNNTAEQWQQLLTATAKRMPANAVLVISGSLPESCDPQLIASLVDAARESRVLTIVDTAGEGLLAAARAGASILKPNRDELTAAVGESDVYVAARSLIAQGAGAVLVSLGREGLLLIGGDNAATPATLRGLDMPLRARLASPLSGNPTGAGDAAVAAVAASLLLSENPHELLRRATGWSAAAVLMPLAGEISDRHREIMETVDIFAAHSATTL
jgi:1-phosphofructokinase family hexose kinase